MNCLVTGSAGFIGINLCKKLLDDGHEVTGIDNFCVTTPDEMMKVCNPYPNFHFHEIDFAINGRSFVFKNIDIIYHLGGMSGVRESILHPDVWFQNNVVGTFNILEKARSYDIPKVVIASSSAAIGDVDPPITEDIPMKPISPYGATKGFKELFASAYYHSYGIDATALRFSNVYGQHSTIKISIVAKFIRKIMKGEELNIYGSGKQTRDFIHVRDLVNAIIAAGNHNVGGETFQISTGIETSVNEMTENICMIMKRHRFSIPLINHIDPVAGDILTNYADNTKAKTMLEWEPCIDIYKGLHETIQWFIKEVKK
jgi:UDP-glucose 4-epimerase